MKYGTSLSPLRSLAKKFKTSPGTLALTAAIFGIVPLWAMVTMPRPWEIFQQATGWKGAVLIFNFWIGPFVVAFCAFTRHKLLIPMFLMECSTILLTSMLQLTGSAPQILTLQWILIAAMVSFSFFLLRRDALYPLMHGNARSWRAAPRLHMGIVMVLCKKGQKKASKVVLQNCSETGMELSGPSSQFKKLFAGKRKADQVDFSLKFKSKIWDFTADIAWAHEEDGEQRVGLHVADKDNMDAFLAVLPKNIGTSPYAETFKKYWQIKPIRNATFSLCAGIFLLALLVPARKHIAFHRIQTPGSQTVIKAELGPLIRLK